MRLFALVVGAAVVVGIAAQVGDAAPGVPHRATALGAPWLIAAFALGAILRRCGAGALGGAVLLAGGTLVYYLVRVLVSGHARFAPPDVVLAWSAAAAAAGAAMGAAGAIWRTSRRTVVTALAAAVPAAAFAGEALLLAGEWRGRVAAALLAAELLLAALLLPACAWRRAPLPAVALAAAVLALAFAAGEHELRGAMRGIGWQGA